MATSIFLPQWGMGMQEATIIKWLKKEGDLVKKGEPLVEVESSKVNAEVESSVDGYLIKIGSGEGQVVKVGAIIAYVGEKDEKIQIAKKYLIPKQIEENALSAKDIKFSETGIKELIRSYTREAGVRNLEREISNVLRKIARKQADGSLKKSNINKSSVNDFLGAPRFYSEMAERMKTPGVVIGLAWTSVGGDILFIEASKMPGKGSLSLTGKLGDVMKESAQAALTYVRSNAKLLGIDPDFHKKNDI